MEDKKVPGEAAGLLIAYADAFLRPSRWRPGQIANLSVLPKGDRGSSLPSCAYALALCLQQQDGAGIIRKRPSVGPSLTMAALSTTGCERSLLWAAE